MALNYPYQETAKDLTKLRCNPVNKV